MGLKDVLETLLDAEIGLFLGQDVQMANKRNGHRVRTFAVKSVGAVQVRVPHDRKGQFESSIVPKGRRYDEELEKDLALLHLAGLSTRVLSRVSGHVLQLRYQVRFRGATDNPKKGAPRYISTFLPDRVVEAPRRTPRHGEALLASIRV